MNATTKQRLEAMRHECTRYEIEMAFSDGRRYLLVYTSQKSNRGILEAIWERSEHVMRVANVDSGTPLVRVGREWRMDCPGGTVTFRFTGRTKRQAIASGDTLQYVGKVAAAMG